MLIEVCANSIGSAMNAFAGGAQRVELCQDLENGGTTPSAATIQIAVERLKPNGMDVFVLIRPRSGDFNYSELEFEVIQRDVLFCKENKADGVVIGLLTPDGKIDLEKTAKLVELAHPMQVTFHRAFDFANDPFEAMEQITGLGIQRILSSGRKSTALEGGDLIRQLIEKANDRIIIMPGSGINSGNIRQIAAITKANEFHFSAKKRVQGSASSINVKNLENEYFLTDSEEVKRVVELMKRNKNG